MNIKYCKTRCIEVEKYVDVLEKRMDEIKKKSPLAGNEVNQLAIYMFIWTCYLIGILLWLMLTNISTVIHYFHVVYFGSAIILLCITTVLIIIWKRSNNKYISVEAWSETFE